jgi:hypothetical protein
MDVGVLFSVAEVDGAGHCVIACMAAPFTGGHEQAQTSNN